MKRRAVDGVLPEGDMDDQAEVVASRRGVVMAAKRFWLVETDKPVRNFSGDWEVSSTRRSSSFSCVPFPQPDRCRPGFRPSHVQTMSP